MSTMINLRCLQFTIINLHRRLASLPAGLSLQITATAGLPLQIPAALLTRVSRWRRKRGGGSDGNFEKKPKETRNASCCERISLFTYFTSLFTLLLAVR
ncbi:hypothetical protein KSP40_PGU002702 [Platanthera guangdongensis]|uniref:Uncharacterized protein n=1 Tax=Platanthera guangdongensis TaxID=2320717 RepID=A0ABR2MFX3_9ASPA